MNLQSEKTNRYYRLHSKIYDLTRWSFLFGRQKAVNKLIEKRPDTVLEIGCGTGRNLFQLANALPESSLYGLDASQEMLDIARKKNRYNNIRWINGYFPSENFTKQIESNTPQFDCILLSYALSMFNPGWQHALQTALDHLKPDGSLILVDFDQTRFNWFKNWMHYNHVVMEGQLVKWLQGHHIKGDILLKKAYGGIWQYFIFEGRLGA